MQLELFPDCEAQAAPTPPERPPLPQVENLAEAAAVVQVALEPRRHAEVLSALNTISRALGQPLHTISSKPAVLREQLAACDPVLKRITIGRWTKVRQHLGTALRACGIEVFQARDDAALSDAWRELLLTTRLKRPYGLQRLLKYLDRKGVEPSTVDANHLEGFRDAMHETSLMPGPQQAWKSSARLWNLAVAATPGWPQVKLEITSDRRELSVPWDTFPPSFEHDVEEFVSASNADPEAVAFEEAPPPITEGTANGRRKLIRLIASAYHRATGRGAELLDLRTLTELDRVSAALTKLRDMQGGVRPTSIHAAELLITIARFRGHGEEHVAKLVIHLRNWRKALRAKDPSRGMRPKNIERLRQFDDPAVVRAFLALPERVFRECSKIAEPTHADARRMLFAVAVEILTVAPMRLSNVVAPEEGRHLIKTGGGRWRLHVRSGEIKWRGDPINLTFTPETSRLLSCYLRDYRALISDKRTSFLFPNPSGLKRNQTSFSAALQEFVRRENGVVVHTHLFRAIALKIHLNARPNALADAQRLLGHRHLSTTEKHYIHYDNERAVAAHGELITHLRQGSRSATDARQ